MRSSTSTDMLSRTAMCSRLSKAASEKSPNEAGVKVPNEVATTKYRMNEEKDTGVKARYKTQNLIPPSNTNNHATTIMPSRGGTAGATITRCNSCTSSCVKSHSIATVVASNRNNHCSQRCCMRVPHSLP